MSRKKRGVLGFWVLLLILGLIFCVSTAKVILQLREERQAEEDFAALSALVRQAQATETAPPETETVRRTEAETQAPEQPPSTEQSDDFTPVKTILAKYESLYARNPDLFGWIRIEDTPIDYPVMYTPDDPEHYLRRDFDGNDRSSGVPFLDFACLPEGNHYLIYGHNMKNGTMFGSLPEYAASAYWQEHPLIRLDTLYEERVYAVMAAFYSAVKDENDGSFRYYAWRDLSNPEVFQAYVEAVKAASLYETGVTAAWGDALLTLSTCAYHTENGRFVVVAKRIQ